MPLARDIVDSMQKKSNQPRQHHYLPRFYLEGFCDPVWQEREGKGVIWVYEKGKPIRSSTPDREARERDFYAFEVDGVRNVEAEEQLSRVEQEAAPIIKRLHEIGHTLTAIEKAWLALFAGTMYTRTPAGRKRLETVIGPAVSRLLKTAANDPDEFRALCGDVNPAATASVNLEEVREDILEGRGGSIARQPGFSLASVLHAGQMVGDALQSFDWQMLYASDSEFFVTSDSPIVTTLEEDQKTVRFTTGFEAPGADVFFPLGKDVCLRMRKGIEPGPAVLPDRGVRYLNKMTMICAHQRVYAGERSTKLQALFNKRGCEVSIADFQPMWKGKPI